jgi:drug/metabolite transporter (DMT)-like permease
LIFNWIFIAASGYFLLAFTSVADKFMVSKVVRQPIAYAFYTAMTGPVSLVLFPFGGKFLNFQDLIVALAAGAFFIGGIYHSYSAIRLSSVSRVVPILGGFIPLFSFLLAFFILDERLSGFQTLGFLFLVVGAVMISFRKEHGIWTPKALFNAISAAAFFALASVLTKYTFDHSNFISGMIWTRVGFLVPVPVILLFPKSREAIFNAPKEAGVRNVALYYSSRATGSIGGFLQNYAVSLGSVSVVNALQGLQFVFLLILTTFLSVRFPKILQEKVTIDTVVLKLSAIGMISCGLYLLFT